MIGPCFISLANIYELKKSKKSARGIIVSWLKEGTCPNVHEKKILLKANIQCYCYNLVPTAIYAASIGLKIKGIGIVNL